MYCTDKHSESKCEVLREIFASYIYKKKIGTYETTQKTIKIIDLKNTSIKTAKTKFESGHNKLRVEKSTSLMKNVRYILTIKVYPKKRHPTGINPRN